MGAPQEQVQRAADVTVVVVLRQPRLQLTMQGQQVKYILQVVTMVEDRQFHGLLCVGRIIGTKPIGFVVGH
eukprot:gene23344-27775_t